LNDDLDLNTLPLKMCEFMRYTCMPNIKSLSFMVKKVWPMLNLVKNKHTDRQTKNKQTNKQT